MSGTFSLVVLCPNARREIVKVSPNSSLLQVLEEACNRQKLSPDDYDLRHSNKPLDLSLPVRFSSLANNAQVELKPATNSRRDSLVTVCLQLESGERFSADFSPSATVYVVIEKCLISNSIAINDVGEIVCIYMRQKIFGDALKSTTLRSLGLTKGKAIFRLLNRKPEELAEQAHVTNPLPPQPFKDQTPALKSYRQPDSPIPDPAKKISRLDPCGLENPEVHNEPKKSENIRKETTSNCADSFLKTAEERKSEESVEIESLSNVEEMECDTTELPEDNFQGISDIKYIGERHAVLYSLDDITEVKKADLPDEFFDLTINDAKYLLEDYRRQRTEFENQPLLSKEQRDRNVLQKLAHYGQTVIRIYFPERLVLQAAFKSTETVEDISDFIREYLEVRNLKFYLYKTPPKENLNSSKTLLESMLIPAAVIYFGCDSQQPRYLKTSLRAQLSDPRAASLAASEARKDCIRNTPVELPAEDVIEINPEVVEMPPMENFVQDPSSNKPSGKVPKWLQLGKK